MNHEAVAAHAQATGRLLNADMLVSDAIKNLGVAYEAFASGQPDLAEPFIADATELAHEAHSLAHDAIAHIKKAGNPKDLSQSLARINRQLEAVKTLITEGVSDDA